jgi:type II secretory ATPase GspE/PulE/Tfp pilus assembly ATPase PilB-like protein
MYEVMVAGETLSDLIERDAPTTDLRDALGRASFVSMADYARFLLEERLASPEAVARAFPSQVLVDTA